MTADAPSIFKCPVCDTVVEVLDEWGLELVCCGPTMVRLREKTRERGFEEHAPVIERTAQGVRVRAGQTRHEMDTDHYIEWIEVCSGGRCTRQFLRPGHQSEAVFEMTGETIVARLYCSAHGLWKSEHANECSHMHDRAAQTQPVACEA